MESKARKAYNNFTDNRLTDYTGLTVVSGYIQSQGIGSLSDGLFPTAKQHATKCSKTQIILTPMLASISDVHRVSRLEIFTCDPLVQMRIQNRVGRGITPPPSHTTVHAFAHGGFF